MAEPAPAPPTAPSFAVHDVPGGPITIAVYRHDGRLEAERHLDNGAALALAHRLLGLALARQQREGRR